MEGVKVNQVVRFRMEVMASSPADAVRWAGGWMCDLAMSGWDVDVLVAGCFDSRPLDILGAGINELGAALERDCVRARAPMLTVATQLFDHDARVHSYVCDAVHHGATGFIVSEPGNPAGLLRPDSFQHRMSAAARAFKAHALVAAGLDASVSAVESFRVMTDGARPVSMLGRSGSSSTR